MLQSTSHFSSLTAAPLSSTPPGSISRHLHNVEFSTSSYDTAWIAMVPSPASGEAPYFPSSVNWIMENQQHDGSWGLPARTRDPLLTKDTLSSTLACILALKQWGIGDQLIGKGLGFMERNSAALVDKAQRSPIGFDVTFPAMVQTSIKDFNLNLPLKSVNIDAILRTRESILNGGSASRNSEGRNAYLAYISEGVGDLNDWGIALGFQRNNGSLFNSPSATAAAFIHHHDPNSLRYLRSVVDVGGSVPAIYPHGIHARLCLIDDVKSLGMNRHFRDEIRPTLDEIYELWEQGDEEIFLDPTTCAMAFRILRLNGYSVSSDVFSRFEEDRFWNDTLEGYLKDERAVLELHKASQVIYPKEAILERQQIWTRQYLMKLNDSSMTSLDNNHRSKSNACKSISSQVSDVLNYAFEVDLDRLTHRRNIEQYCVDDVRTLKSSFRCSSFGNKELLKLAVEDFNFGQSFYQDEQNQLMRWLKEYKLDGLRMAKVKLGYCCFTAATTFFDPKLSHARISWAKHGVLTSFFDDVFDVDGTTEEKINLLELLERWDVASPKVEFCSERVETIYWALHDAICETVANALPFQGRSIMDHVVQTWVDLVRVMMHQREWAITNTTPTLDEYMETASVLVSLGPVVLPALYLLGPQLSDEVARGPEIDNMFMVLSNCGRLLNDRMCIERDAEEGLANAVSLLMSQRGETTLEAMDEEIKVLIDEKTKELLRLVLDERHTAVPRECRELFWKMNKVMRLVYNKSDAFNSTDLFAASKSLIEEPISLTL